MSYIQDLQDVIRKLHGVESRHMTSVPVREIFDGKTVWEGMVEIFSLKGHPKAKQAYAWAHDGKRPKESSVAVLHMGSITSASAAVRAALVQEFRSLESEEN
jgi:hypothetical protein